MTRCLSRSDKYRPVVDRLVELSSPSVADPVSFGETAGPLWGTVTSTSGERLEGVTVSARAPGRNVTTSVFTDSDGEYYFPPLETGRPYKVWAQAFEAGRAEVALSEAGARQNFTLTPNRGLPQSADGEPMVCGAAGRHP